jgi:hypothetical protein
MAKSVVQKVLIAATALAVSASFALADDIAISYQASTSGAPMMKASLAATLDGETYSASFNAKTTGVTNMLSKYKIGMNVSGTMAGSKLKPNRFTKAIDKKKKDKSADLAFEKDGTFTLVTQDGPVEESADVMAAAKGKAIDPVSALLRFAVMQGAAGAKPCSGSLRTYDGRDVVDFTLGLVEKHGEAYECKLTYKSVAGRDVENNEGETVSYGLWLSPVPVPSSETPLYLPLRLTGSYNHLPVTVEATGVSVNGAAVSVQLPD